jgi:predicted dehydrogenase
MRPVDVVVIGAGMYVCGRGTRGFGTVLPAVAQAQRDGRVGEITVAAHGIEGKLAAEQRLAAWTSASGTDAHVRVLAAPEPKDLGALLGSLRPGAAVIVAVPDTAHEETATTAIACGHHTLVVKPLAPTLAAGRRLAAAARTRGVYGAVEFHKRWDLANVKLRDLVRAGTLGDPVYALVEYSQRRSLPLEVFRSWAPRANVFQYLGVHYVDLLHHVTGWRPVRVAATAQRTLLRGHGVDTPDAVQALIEWEHPERRGLRFAATIATGWIDPDSTTAVSEQRLVVVGTGGRYDSDQKRRGVEIALSTAPAEDWNPYFCQAYDDPDAGRPRWAGYGIASITQFLDDARAVNSGERTPAWFEGRRPTFQDALPSCAVIEAVNASMTAGGAWCEVPLS